MTFRIPPEAIQMPGVEISKPQNLFVLYLLNRTWESWAATFLPADWSFRGTNNELEIPEDSQYMWTLVSGDEGQFVQVGVSDYGDGTAAFWTSGFIRTMRSRSEVSWAPFWIPPSDLWFAELNRVSFVTPGSASPIEVVNTVWVGCELCTLDELADGDCRHWSDGEFHGTWVGVDFSVPNDEDVIDLLKRVARDETLGSLSCLAASMLVNEFLNPDAVAKQIQRWTQVAVDRAQNLSEDSRDLGIENDKLLPEVAAELNK